MIHAIFTGAFLGSFIMSYLEADYLSATVLLILILVTIYFWREQEHKEKERK